MKSVKLLDFLYCVRSFTLAHIFLLIKTCRIVIFNIILSFISFYDDSNYSSMYYQKPRLVNNAYYLNTIIIKPNLISIIKNYK